MYMYMCRFGLTMLHVNMGHIVQKQFFVCGNQTAFMHVQYLTASIYTKSDYFVIEHTISFDN